MDYHKNAPWTAVSRERLARMVIEDGIRLEVGSVPVQCQRQDSSQMGGPLSAVWPSWPCRSQLASAPQPAADQFLISGKGTCTSSPDTCPATRLLAAPA